MARDTFEVYYHQNGRWQLHASFESGEREVAVEEATMVANKEGYATRVVRETFYPDTNTTEDVVTWQSPKAKEIGDADNMFGTAKPNQPAQRGTAQAQRAVPRPKGSPSRPPPAPRKAKGARSAPAQGKKTKKNAKGKKGAAPKGKVKRKSKRNELGSVTRIIMSLSISLGVALIGAAMIALVIAQMVSMNILPPANRLPLITGTFVSLFFLSVFINLQKHFNLLGVFRGSRRAATQNTGPAQMMAVAATSKPAPPPQDVEFDQVEVEPGETHPSGLEDAEEEDAPADLGADLDAEVSTDPAETAAEDQTAAAPEPEIKESNEEPKAEGARKQEKPKADEKAVEKKKEEKKAPAASAAENEVRANLANFVRDAVTALKGMQLNTFTRFGFNLYVAGAASVVGQTKKLSRDDQLKVLKDSLVSAGTNPASATTFCVELPSHGKNQRYAGMIKAGSKAMTDYMGGAPGAVSSIGGLLADWNLPDKRPPVPSVITFLFTDIVGSTAMTQRLGNAGAQKAVRAHNDAVRSAIKAQKGREVKHTGDGIMATFPSPAAAVAGAIHMQRTVAAHNASNPNLEVQVRIGINAGEAVEEENDFFGAAVQMTARICDKATTGNIWVSQTIVDSCRGQKFGFIPRGGFDMKGIQGRKPLYEVGWSDAHKNELADL
ncbi:MAG: adenylate/guanylate cyclase domain-containing protein [Rhodospirillaceae bacterium]